MATKHASTSTYTKKFKIMLILCYTCVVVIAIIAVTGLTLSRTSRTLKNKVATLTSALNVQMKLNINSYLEDLEKTGLLIFINDDYRYDKSDESYSDYDRIQIEKTLSDRLTELGLMQNFGDFCIVYSDNSTIGKISNNTRNLYSDQLYAEMCKAISRERTADGWVTGYNNDFNRLYYVKRIHENAILMTSFYTSELESVFEYPSYMHDMTIRLVDRNGRIIYSSSEQGIGEELSAPMLSRINAASSATVLDDEYLITVNDCDNDWRVICSIPTDIILQENADIQREVALLSTAISLLAILVVVLLSMMLSNPVESMMSHLNTKAERDLLTGILNKKSFEGHADALLAKQDSTLHFAFYMLDIDDFKQVNDRLGHAAGDDVLARTGQVLATIAEKCPQSIVGRLGGDEFAILLSTDDEDYMAFFIAQYHAYRTLLQSEVASRYTDVKVTSSVGISVFGLHGDSFNDLYYSADSALYQSKRNGKNTYTIAEAAVPAAPSGEGGQDK